MSGGGGMGGGGMGGGGTGGGGMSGMQGMAGSRTTPQPNNGTAICISDGSVYVVSQGKVFRYDEKDLSLKASAELAPATEKQPNRVSKPKGGPSDTPTQPRE